MAKMRAWDFKVKKITLRYILHERVHVSTGKAGEDEAKNKVPVAGQGKSFALLEDFTWIVYLNYWRAPWREGLDDSDLSLGFQLS